MTVIGPHPSGRLDEEGLACGQPFEYEVERLTTAALIGVTGTLASGSDTPATSATARQSLFQ